MHKRSHYLLVSALAIMSAGFSSAAMAQDATMDLASSDGDTLRSELQMRYDAALGATQDDTVLSANDSRYIWASEAKVQCAIALGYLKSRTRDETSIEKCDYAYQRMTPAPVAVVAPPPVTAAPPPQICNDRQPSLIFFEFDADVPGSDATQTIQFVTENAAACGWDAFRVVGHTDRAGSNEYNDALSARRAESVANLMNSLGISRDQMSVSSEGENNPRVPTEDGVRSPQNRRVEITISE